MAILRDAVTSEFIFEGTPLQVVRLADQLGRDEVLFDAVGPAFDPDAVLRAHGETVEGLSGALGEARGSDRTSLQRAVNVAQAEANVDSIVRDAQDSIERARMDYEPGHDDDEPDIPENPGGASLMPKETEPIVTEFRQGPDGTPERSNRS